jgi:hypothetical protein
MPIALGTGDTIGGKVDAGSDVNYFIDGDQISGGADVYDLLATAQLTTTPTTLYTVPASTSAIIGHIRLVNTGTSSRVVSIYRNSNTTGGLWFQGTLNAGESAEWTDGLGWVVYDSTGAWKEAQALANGYALKSFTEIAQGTTTYTPPAGVRALMVHCVGAGGGGGGVSSAASNAACGGGGGGGAYSRKWVTAPKSSYTVAVGTGGTAGANTGGNGGAGGDTTFDSPAVCTAKGGALGTGQTAGTTVAGAAGGLGGAAGSGVGDQLIDGDPGGPGMRFSGTQGVAGIGGHGAGPFGGGGATAPSAGGAGNVGKQWGGGGSGGLVLNGSAAAVGGAGSNGRLIVEEYF